MKKTVLLLLVVLIAPALTLSAQEYAWGSMFSRGNMMIGGDASLEFNGYGSTQLALYPSAEVILFKPVWGDLGFLDFGATVKGRFGLPLGGGDLSAGVGVLGTMHFGFRGLDFPGSEYLEKVDVYAELGLGFDLITSGDRLVATVNSGVNYFFSDTLAVGLNYSDWGDFAGAGLSVSLKLGPKPVVKGLGVDFRGMAAQAHLLQFYALFYAAHYAGGFYPGDNYPVGTGTIHRVSVTDNDGVSSYLAERALLDRKADGTLLWSLKYSDDEESIYYEYLTTADYMVLTVYYDAPEEGLLVLDAANAQNRAAQEEYKTWKDYSTEEMRRETVRVEAGSFQTSRYTYDDGESDVEFIWWLSPDVPGEMVLYTATDPEEEVRCELIKITKGNRAKLQ